MGYAEYTSVNATFEDSFIVDLWRTCFKFDGNMNAARLTVLERMCDTRCCESVNAWRATGTSAGAALPPWTELFDHLAVYRGKDLQKV